MAQNFASRTHVPSLPAKPILEDVCCVEERKADLPEVHGAPRVLVCPAGEGLRQTVWILQGTS